MCRTGSGPGPLPGTDWPGRISDWWEQDREAMGKQTPPTPSPISSPRPALSPRLLPQHYPQHQLHVQLYFLVSTFSRPTLSPPPLPSPSPHPVCVAQSCLTVCDPMGHSPPGSSVHAISQARILEPVAILFSQPLPTPS